MSEEKEKITPVETASRPRILVADDEPMIRELMKAGLRREEFEVVTVGNGLEALKALTAPGKTFSLLITDKDMPRTGGLEVLRKIRESDDDELRKIPVIMMSGSFDPQTKQELQKLEVPVIAKPFNIQQIKQVVEKTLSSKS